MDKNREILKTNFDWKMDRDQKKGIKAPTIVKAYGKDATIISLPKPSKTIIRENNFHKLVENRKTIRKYTGDILRIDELSYLLWSTQGIKSLSANGLASFRTVASGGARHPFETYLAVEKVEGLRPGIYRYLPIEHELLLVREDNNLRDKITEASLGQSFMEDASVQFIYSCIPYRTEWRYAKEAHKIILVDLGIISHSVYMSATALNLGTCAVGAYDQKIMDDLIEVDGDEEFVVFTMPIGKI